MSDGAASARVSGEVASAPAKLAAQLRCGFCGGPARPAGPRLIACAACGSATTFPVPDDRELAAAYAGSYRPAEGRFGAGGDRLLAATRGRLARRIDAVAPPGPVLDVGAGDGTLVAALLRRGREAVGLERGGPSAPMGTRPIVAAELADFDSRAGEWAAIVMWHSLEHLRDPAGALAHAAGLLAPGGVLLIAVPNRDSWQARILADRWLALDLPRHLTHLSAAALTDALSGLGLEVERVSHWRGGQVLFGWLHGILAALPGRPDLYDAVRQPTARTAALTSRQRGRTLAAAVLLSPAAALASAGEVLTGHGGSVFIQARRRAAGRQPAH